ncbi:MAG: NAD-dependent epimerase/dehydratase family protein [Chloroflexi bacterium]|nr:NAD-dependent epimerase/dehydratase family protein [Chloroflexota bacterium]
MHIVIIGATGHVGTYLLPRLAALGHRLTALSRGKRQPYHPHGAWGLVDLQQCNRALEDSRGTFGKRIADLKPDVIIDMICFNAQSARQLVEALGGSVEHLIVCGTIWVHGPSAQVPTLESAVRHPFGDYGINKNAMEAYLLQQSRLGGVPATVIHPGHIVGPGWAPLNPQGNFNPQVYSGIAAGEELVLPNFGLETVHHVHADDVAQLFQLALERWSASASESYHAVSPAALTLRGYAEAVYGWFGQEPQLTFRPFDAWKACVSADDAAATYDHIAHSPNCSIAKAQQQLGYQPRYSSLQAVYEALDWLIAHGKVTVPGK